MSRVVVQELLREIDGLDRADRMALERELARRLQAEWKSETAKAHKIVRRRKIDQKFIDRVIERRRYGA